MLYKLNFLEANEYIIKKAIGYGNKKGLEAMELALKEMGMPQEKIPTIHIAGTNGKGSTCAMLSSILKDSGYRVGVYTSPHLEKINERFLINNEYISDSDFADIVQKIKNISDRVLSKGEKFSFFEILTMLAFEYFYTQKVDIIILEVGVGGRLDATNVIKKPLLSIITSISFDHMELLGDTIEKIATEKAGIIKKDRPVVISENIEEVYSVVEDIAYYNNSKLYKASDTKISNIKSSLLGSEFNLEHNYYGSFFAKMQLIGEYQIKNAKTAILSAFLLKELGYKIERKNVENGIYNAKWAGRMEIISKKPIVIIDGAHNFDGAKYAASFLKKQADEGYNIISIIGISKEKEYDKIINLLSINSNKIIFTESSYAERAIDAGELSKIIKNENTFIEQDYKKALELSYNFLENNGMDIIFCCGSLFLIADIRSCFDV